LNVWKKNDCIDQMVTNIYFSEMYVNVFLIQKLLVQIEFLFLVYLGSIFKDSGKY